MKHFVRLLMATAIAVTSWAEQPTLPVKGQLHWLVDSSRKTDVPTNVVLRLYDKPQGGSLLFEEQQTVNVDSSGIFVAFVGEKTRGGVPARITNSASTVWAEYSFADSPGINLAPQRQQITYRKSNDAVSPNAISVAVDPSLCYTCGGAYPTFAGSISTPANTTERGSSCSGALTTSTDTRPFLCGR